MKMKILALFMALSVAAFGQSSTLTINTTTGLVNIPGGSATPNFAALKVGSVTITPVTYGTGVATFLAAPTSANLAAALTNETGTGAAVFATSPTLVTPILGTPASGTLTNCTLPIGAVTGLGTGVATALAVNTGSAGAPVLFNGALGTPSSGTLTNATGLPIGTGVSGLGSGFATFAATPSSANLAAALTDETGTGAAVFAESPTLTGTLTVPTTTLTAAVAPTAAVADTTALSERVFRQSWSQGRYISIIPSGVSFTANPNGTGASALLNFGKCRLISGTDAAGYGAMFSLDQVAAYLNTIGGVFDSIDFGKPFWVDILFGAGANAIDGTNVTSLNATAFGQWTIGKTNGNGALAQAGFGFQIVNATNTTAGIKILSYDSALHTSATIATVDFVAANKIIHSVSFYNDGTGNLIVYVDGIYTTTIATGPTGIALNRYMVAECNNNGTASASSEVTFLEFRIGLKKN